jgi:hypothetical protein
MRRLSTLVAFVTASQLVAALAEETEVSFAYVPAPNAETVTIEQPLGRLALHGWDRPEVRIVAKKHAPDGATLDRLRVNVEMRDGRIRIRTGVRMGDGLRPLPPPVGGAGIDLTIDAPQRVALHATTWAGDLDATGFRAGAELASTGGEVTASDIQGPVHCNSVKGRQHLSSIHGDVEAEGVTGDLEFDTVDGDVLDARVVEGQVVARQVASRVVRLFSTVGGVIFVGKLRAGGRYELSAGEGDVRVAIVKGPFSLAARAPAGHVEARFAISGALTPSFARGEFMGGGPSLELAAYKGNVVLSPAP